PRLQVLERGRRGPGRPRDRPDASALGRLPFGAALRGAEGDRRRRGLSAAAVRPVSRRAGRDYASVLFQPPSSRYQLLRKRVLLLWSCSRSGPTGGGGSPAPPPPRGGGGSQHR